MPTPTERKRDGQNRRRELCDAAIRVLAEQGSRGLSHQQVDRCAGAPNGTTSYYYRTRAALLRGVAERVAEIDTENLLSWTDEATATPSPFARVAELVMRQADGPGLSLNKARHELLLAATRDPGLAEVYQGFVSRILAMANDAVVYFHLSTSSADDAALRELQTTAVTTFIAGVFARFIAGDRAINNAEQLDGLLRAIVDAVSIAHANEAPRTAKDPEPARRPRIQST
jgi:DNA-binding transcriptional regulator YbjK